MQRLILQFNSLTLCVLCIFEKQGWGHPPPPQATYVMHVWAVTYGMLHIGELYINFLHASIYV
jgi:hypothetical protein